MKIGRTMTVVLCRHDDERPPRRFDARRYEGGDRPPRRFEDGDRPPRRFEDGDRPPRRFEDGDRPPRRFDDEGGNRRYNDSGARRFNDGERRFNDGEGRGRGRGMGRGGRGRGGPGGKREFDRHSGSERSGVKSTDKREGGGAYNWGSAKDQIDEVNNAEAQPSNAELDTSAEDKDKVSVYFMVILD